MLSRSNIRYLAGTCRQMIHGNARDHGDDAAVALARRSVWDIAQAVMEMTSRRTAAAMLYAAADGLVRNDLDGELRALLSPEELAPKPPKPPALIPPDQAEIEARTMELKLLPPPLPAWRLWVARHALALAEGVAIISFILGGLNHGF